MSFYNNRNVYTVYIIHNIGNDKNLDIIEIFALKKMFTQFK